LNNEILNSGLIDIHNHVGVDLLFYLNGHHPYSQSWPVLAAEAEACGIRRLGVWPMVSHLALGIEGMRRGVVDTAGALEAVPYEFENRRLVSELAMFPDLADRAIPVWMVDPARSTLGQIAALRNLRKTAVCHMLKIQGTIIQSRVIELLRGGECFLDLAEEWNVPFIIHSSVRPDDEWSQVADILQVAEQRPGVRFCLAHSCRFDRAGLDRVAEMPNTWFDCSAHRIHCMLAAKNDPAVAPTDRRFPADYRDTGAVLAKLAEAYPEKLCWGSDSPFYSYVHDKIQLLSSYREEVADLMALPEEVRLRVGRDNTLALLNGKK
jgi:predicted TIM-barrel fold metal-dependent hydrolase